MTLHVRHNAEDSLSLMAQDRHFVLVVTHQTRLGDIESVTEFELLQGDALHLHVLSEPKPEAPPFSEGAASRGTEDADY